MFYKVVPRAPGARCPGCSSDKPNRTACQFVAAESVRSGPGGSPRKQIAEVFPIVMSCCAKTPAGRIAFWSQAHGTLRRLETKLPGGSQGAESRWVERQLNKLVKTPTQRDYEIVQEQIAQASLRRKGLV